MPSSGPQPIAASTDDWRLLQSLALYRLALVALLVMLQETGAIAQLFELLQPRTFFFTCRLYALASLPALWLTVYRRSNFPAQVLGNFALDVVAIAPLVYASGGVSAGLGMLLIPPVVSTSLLLSMRMGLLAASVATLAMFGQEISRQFPHLYSPSDFTTNGVLGIMFFVTAGAGSAVARRARKSEALARRMGNEFADLSRLNEFVLDTMQTGVLVVDTRNRIRSLNAAAAQLLGCRPDSRDDLSIYSADVVTALKRWRAGSATPEPPIAPTLPDGKELLIRFRRLGVWADSPVLVLLEDAARIRDQAQQIKLAALGRLSASIAHEIRNPLAAITHAGQLLAESPALTGGDRRLLDIVQRHGLRINTIIKDVLSLSRGGTDPQTFLLLPWLQQVLAQYAEAYPERHPVVEVAPTLTVRFDPSHLQQVLFNLLDNAWLHGRRDGQPPTVYIRARIYYHQGGVLEVSDDGPGLPGEAAQHLFEPFFTTQTQGTGLGLYLARELCANNQAKLSHHVEPPNGKDRARTLFRVTFVAPDTPDT